MKLMTYNILNGAKETLPLVMEVIKTVSPDYLTINEANTFTKNNNEILTKVAKELNFPYFNIALFGEHDYHVAVYSKYPFFKTYKLKPLARSCLINLVKTEIGEISIASLHLIPYTEDLRLPEIDLIIDFQNKYKNRILMGDMNSLSKYDGYDPKIIRLFNEMQMKKFTSDGKFRFDAIDKIMSGGYFDPAVELKKCKDFTAPTSINEYSAHSNMRLDYIFLSKALLHNLESYSVIKNDLTNKASDHFPVMVELN